MQIRKITREEFLEAKKIALVAFESPEAEFTEDNEAAVRQAEENPAGPGEQHWQECYAAFDENNSKMMASMTVMPFCAYFDGEEVPMNGVGGVSTLPQYRRGGAVRGCFSAALADMYKRGDVFSYLYPFSYAFYRKFGYELSAETVFWRVKLAALPKANLGGSIEMYEPGCDMLPFEDAYNAYARPINLMLKRDEILWKRRVTGFSPYTTRQWSFVWKDGQGRAQGYLTYQSDVKDGQRIMTLRDFCFADVNALSALLEFMASFSSQYDFADVPLPPHISLTGLIPELSFGQVTRTMQFTGMLRVVNVKKALELARYKGSGRFVVSVRDETIPENTGVYSVDFGGGKTAVAATDEAPDLETDIQSFGRLISGAQDINNIELFPGIRVNGNMETLSRAFYQKPLWINDYF